MNLLSIFTVFVILFEEKYFSRGLSVTRGIQEAFSEIVHSLEARKHGLTVFNFKTENETSDLAPFASTAVIPHLIARVPNKPKQYELKTSAIVSLDSLDSLYTFRQAVYLSTTYMPDQVFVHFQKTTFLELKTIGLIFADSDYFLVEEETSIRLLTFIEYTEEKCDKSQLVEVNSFDRSKRKWQNGNFRIDKSSNFHGCQLTFMIDNSEPAVIGADIENVMIIKSCEGYVCAMLRDFGRSLNYTQKMILYFPPRELRKRREHVPPWDLILQINYLSVFQKQQSGKPKHRQLVATRPVYSFEVFIAIPPGEELNGYEKLVLPFDDDTWMWIGITFAAAFVTIIALRFVPPAISNFVMGKGNKTPVLNVIRAFFGISQIVCPGRNFARYLLMMFILFSLIIRTAYQGVMFEFLQKEMRKPTVETIEEMIDKNFTFYMQLDFKRFHNESDLVIRGNVVDDWTKIQLEHAFKSLYTPGPETGVYYYKDLFNDLFRSALNLTKPPKLLSDRYMLESMAFVFYNDHFLYKVFDRKLQQYIEADLINYNIRTWQENNNPKKYEE